MTLLPGFSAIARTIVAALAVTLTTACGGPTPPPAAPEPEPATQASPAEPAQEIAPAAPSSDPTPEADTAPAAKKPAKDDPDNRQRQIYYRTGTEGLVISIEGVELTVKAELNKLKTGAFGIRLKMTVESKDDGMHTLLSPKDGPLAIGGVIKRKKGDSVPIVDKRDGEDEQFITPGAPLEFQVNWPGTDGPFAWYGDEVELQVGLWGIGNAGERRRPITKLCIVKLVAVQGGKPVVMAPKI